MFYDHNNIILMFSNILTRNRLRSETDNIIYCFNLFNSHLLSELNNIDYPKLCLFPINMCLHKLILLIIL